MTFKVGKTIISSEKLEKSQADALEFDVNLGHDIVIKSGEVYYSTHSKNLKMFMDMGYKLYRHI